LADAATGACGGYAAGGRENDTGGRIREDFADKLMYKDGTGLPPQGRTVRAGAALPPGGAHQLNSVNIGMDSYPGRIAIPAPGRKGLPGLVAEGIVMNSRRRHTSRWDSVERVMRLLASAASAAGGFAELINSLYRLR